MKTINFTVDSALLRELGERLVGRPHIALAELIKNSYDADAETVEVTLTDDSIVVSDNGHGMTFEAFRDFWMRIGSPHKQRRDVSPGFHRPLTGSKGVGRLSAQFLGHRLTLRTVPKENVDEELYAEVNWDDAVEKGDLTRAEAKYEERPPTGPFPSKKSHGTEVTIERLSHSWPSNEFVQLAREIWWLQVPFTSPLPTERVAHGDFQVQLISPYQEAVDQFTRQMTAFLNLWEARLLGRLLPVDDVASDGPRQVELVIEYKDRDRVRTVYTVAPCRLNALTFEIRVFQLRYRQPYGLRVEDVRQYLQQYGGVHIYDAGFHLPYYGVDSDWLRIEQDTSRRLARSQLLPLDLQVPDGLLYLPRNPNLFGVVNVDTSYERRQRDPLGRDHLVIQISRDRLVDNGPFQDLSRVVRWAVDFYANEDARRAYQRVEAQRDIVPFVEKIERVEEVLERYGTQMPPEAYLSLRTEVSAVLQAAEAETARTRQQLGLLGALATAGISALAYEHEVGKQLTILESLAARLRTAASSQSADATGLVAAADEIGRWVDRARATRALFTPLLSEENRTTAARFKARFLLDEVQRQLRPLLRSITIDTTRVDESLRLPAGTYAEWTSLLQNVVTNAANALLDSDKRQVVARSEIRGERCAILVEDTGVGVDLANADSLFEPFVRHQEISPERQQLGLGGMGLGLTIVRMIATNLGCEVGFAPPDAGFSTAFRIAWRERDGQDTNR